MSLIKIANDLRWLASGPRCAIGEIGLPDTQPGSSIMPGKVNPVLLRIGHPSRGSCHRLRRDDYALRPSGEFELNVTMPIVTLKLLEAIEFTANAVNALTEKCVIGIEANEARCRELVEKSLAMVTALAPLIGYDAAAALRMKRLQAARRFEKWRSSKELLTPEQLDKALDPWSMTMPGREKEQ